MTGSAQGEDANYFRIHINHYNAVDAITCFSRKVNALCVRCFLSRCCRRSDAGCGYKHVLFWKHLILNVGPMECLRAENVAPSLYRLSLEGVSRQHFDVFVRVT